jgi:hypothetical protein
LAGKADQTSSADGVTVFTDTDTCSPKMSHGITPAVITAPPTNTAPSESRAGGTCSVTVDAVEEPPWAASRRACDDDADADDDGDADGDDVSESDRDGDAEDDGVSESDRDAEPDADGVTD